VIARDYTTMPQIRAFSMRNFLLASFTAATAVILSGEIFAGDQQLQSSVSTMAVNLADSRSNSETVVPSESTFPNQIDRAQTIKSVQDITVTDQLRGLIENRLDLGRWLSPSL
jgi:hypothetical protein